MSHDNRTDDRLAELLADQALEGLTPEQELELESLLAAAGTDTDLSMSVTAASLELALLQPQDVQAMPPRALQRLQQSGKQWARATSTVLRIPQGHNDPLPIATRRAKRMLGTMVPWLAAAACLVIALITWWRPRQDLVSLVDAQPVKLAANWTDWDKPEISGVRGRVVWCDKIQKGYMQFAGLPKNDPELHQYQLWIIDERGMGQRISGGVFNVEDDGEVMVPINAGLEVRNAQAFAVTIERPGGTWVSDMTRRVAIASK